MKKFFISFIYLYRWLISPFLPPACKFTPTCSRYAISAIECHGMMKGLWMTLKRLLRCNPYNKSDSYDPIPQKQSAPASLSSTPFSEPLQATLNFSDSLQPANSSHSRKLKRAHHA